MKFFIFIKAFLAFSAVAGLRMNAVQRFSISTAAILNVLDK